MRYETLAMLALHLLLMVLATNAQSFTSKAYSSIMNFTTANFKEKQAEGTWFIMFYTPWSPHSKKMMSTWLELAKETKGQVGIGWMNCDEEPTIKEVLSISEYPTFILFHEDEMYEYQRAKNKNDFKAFALGGFQKLRGEPLPAPLSRPFQFKKLLKQSLSQSTGLIKLLLSGSSWQGITIVIFIIFTWICTRAFKATDQGNKGTQNPGQDPRANPTGAQGTGDTQRNKQD